MCLSLGFFLFEQVPFNRDNGKLYKNCYHGIDGNIFKYELNLFYQSFQSKKKINLKNLHI